MGTKHDFLTVTGSSLAGEERRDPNPPRTPRSHAWAPPPSPPQLVMRFLLELDASTELQLSSGGFTLPHTGRLSLLRDGDIVSITALCNSALPTDAVCGGGVGRKLFVWACVTFVGRAELPPHQVIAVPCRAEVVVECRPAGQPLPPGTCT